MEIFGKFQEECLGSSQWSCQGDSFTNLILIAILVSKYNQKLKYDGDLNNKLFQLIFHRHIREDICIPEINFTFLWRPFKTLKKYKYLVIPFIKKRC